MNDSPVIFYFSDGGSYNWTVNSNTGATSVLEGEWEMGGDGLVQISPHAGSDSDLKYAAFDGSMMSLAPSLDGFELTALVQPGVAQAEIALFLDSVESNPMFESFTYTSADQHLRQYNKDVEQYPDVPRLGGPFPGTVDFVLVDANQLMDCMRWLENEPHFRSIRWKEQPLQLFGTVNADRP